MLAHHIKNLEHFFSKFPLLKYKKGEMILRSDDPPHGVYYINKGYVRVYSISEEGEELLLIIFKPQDVFPIIWAIEKGSNRYNVDAITDVEIFRAPQKAFLDFLKRESEVLLELFTKITIRLSGLLTRFEYAIFGNAYTKVAAILAICSERFGKKSKKGIVIQVPLTHKDIASFLGLARETVSIEMKKLKNKNLINYKNHFLIIKNIKKLKEESQIG